MFTNKDRNKIDHLKSSFNFSVLSSCGPEKYPDLSFISPMLHLNWHVGHDFVDLCNDPENIDKIKYKLDLKLFIASLIRTKKVENIKINPYVSVLIAKVDSINSTCNLYLSIRGQARIYEGEDKEINLNKFFKHDNYSVQNYFRLDKEKETCLIIIESESFRLYNLWESVPETGG